MWLQWFKRVGSKVLLASYIWRRECYAGILYSKVYYVGNYYWVITVIRLCSCFRILCIRALEPFAMSLLLNNLVISKHITVIFLNLIKFRKFDSKFKILSVSNCSWLSKTISFQIMTQIVINRSECLALSYTCPTSS